MQRISSPFKVATSKDRISMIRQSKMFFSEADTNHDNELDFDEYEQGLPENIKRNHSAAQIREWFDLVDKDGSGRITMDEFFLWSLGAASVHSGKTIKNIFMKYDTDGSGSVDRYEFTRAAQEVGFGDTAAELFEVFDTGGDGSIDYIELSAALHQMKSQAGGSGTFSSSTKSFLMAMAWDSTEDTNRIDTSGWSFTASDAGGIRAELIALGRRHGVRLTDLFEQLDASDDHILSHDEFCDNMLQIGFHGARSVLELAWGEVDADGTGKVCMYICMHTHACVCVLAWEEVGTDGTGKVSLRSATTACHTPLSLPSPPSPSTTPHRLTTLVLHPHPRTLHDRNLALATLTLSPSSSYPLILTLTLTITITITINITITITITITINPYPHPHTLPP